MDHLNYQKSYLVERTFLNYTENTYTTKNDIDLD